MFKQKFPTMQDWISAGFILVAVFFLTRAERRRSSELAQEKAARGPHIVAAAGARR
jgi:hypothetical protein